MKSYRGFRWFSFAVVGAGLMLGLVVTSSRVTGQFGRGGQAAQPQAEPEEPQKKLAPGEKPPSLLIEIPDEPKTVDPASLLPAPLAKKVTVSFTDQPLKEIVKWLQDELSITVLVDTAAFSQEGLLLGDPITDHLDDAPVYLLLNRLKSLLIGWYFEDGILHLTTQIVVDEHTTTAPYNLSDLFDAGYKSTIARIFPGAVGGMWDDSPVLLGDVIFVRQTFHGHLEVAGLLSALRKHGRRTFILDPPEHDVLREKLNQKVTVNFDDSPLATVVKELAQQVKADLRLNPRTLNEEGIAPLTPITLKMTDQPLSTVLRAILPNLSLTFVPEDGVLWITTLTAADEKQQTALFDVRDLCRNNNESNGLMRALHIHTRGQWENVDGEGGRMLCPKPGVLMVRNNRQVLDELLTLLESYRAALRISKPRDASELDPKEVIVKYYRLQKEIATDLEKLLPELVQPETWKSPARPDGTGTIRIVASTSGRNDNVLVANSVLIIRQSREVHDSIEKMVANILQGDSGGALKPPMQGAGMGGMGGGMGGMGGGMGGMGGGGFGGGFFSTPAN